MSDDGVPVPDLTVRSRRRDGVVYVERDGTTWQLDEVGSLIWDSLDGLRTVADICAIVETTYPHVPAPQLRADVVEFLSEMADKQLVIREIP